MKNIYKMESVLISIAVILCAVLLIKLLNKLRSVLPWRVNCWFCNNYFWIKYPERNCWTCQKCEQYNGFTKDGDYNKPITAFNDFGNKTPKIFQHSPPKNGLCKMCNINQQLKVAQLANFVPMNEKKYDDEIESYRLQLEKAYKLCSPCKKVVQMKLHKEKETLLGSKLLQTRTPEKLIPKSDKTDVLMTFINNTSMLIAVILFILISFEFYTNLIIRYKNLHSTINNIKEITLALLERVYSIVEMKTTMTFPWLQGYFYDLMKLMPNNFNFNDVNIDQVNLTIQKALGGFVCLLQTVGLVWNVNSLKNTIVIDLQWLIFVIATLGNKYIALEHIYLSLTKIICILILMTVYNAIKTEARKKIPIKISSSPKRMKNLANSPTNTSSLIDEDFDPIHLDTDDDVSLSKFGLHNFSESSNETISPLNNLLNGRTFTPRIDTLWSKPKLNSTFCVNTVKCQSPSSVSDTIFVKPSFKKYQKLVKDDSDSELDESISSLCIGSPSKAKKTNPVFSLRKFSATPSFVAPTPITRSRPLISPSKLGHSTSWVAGGYWGSEGERQLFSIDGSRSSSQSSGFESQTSSMNQRNVFSQPPSREESVCGEAMILDRFQTMSNFNGFQTPQNFGRVTSPIFPQMQYNSHVHIPQPQFSNQNPGFAPSNAFVQHQSSYERGVFKAPNGSGLIKLPQVKTFTSR